ncbi:Abi family protein [Pseudomonas mandelii]|uniref:Abi family protein n=1 Tax=Pseudomonas mandelii TaxID=75612 RepID=UPI003B968F5A
MGSDGGRVSCRPRSCNFRNPFARPPLASGPKENLYKFDKQLRMLMLDAVERLEVHLKTVMAHEIGYQVHPRVGRRGGMGLWGSLGVFRAAE